MVKSFKTFLWVAMVGLLQVSAAMPASAQDFHHGGGGYHHGYGGYRAYGHYGYGPRYYGRSWYGGRWYHGWYGGNPGWWWLVGSTWFLYPDAVYPYPDPNVQPLASIPAPPAGQNAPYWYWCGNPAGYYPTVGRCLMPWQAVSAGVAVATPPAGIGGGGDNIGSQQQIYSQLQQQGQQAMPDAPPPQPPVDYGPSGLPAEQQAAGTPPVAPSSPP